ncbi:hypothetical protein Ngar_c07490 [Candidatus Nitrososphaera gargensis Ga9.2]|uniref:Uncharacterized protein n=1 Tax=Nitrososphaera gargensis (strain Ga9.2) TaxID=1237085 RepID=K0II88_NITGG|nr:hypothetical protein [Candidatus Nitrososphaera gargensis]AFU57692.1 hypothetical protein Ngar_c07490 [Candidatus Nitrososphaera gargensis Ga9.2]
MSYLICTGNEAVSKEASIIINDWRPLRIDSRGWVVVVKNVNGLDNVKEFYPAGEWKKAYEYLKIQSELRALLFSELTAEQINEYRMAIGLPPSEGL